MHLHVFIKNVTDTTKKKFERRFLFIYYYNIIVFLSADRYIYLDLAAQNQSYA